MKVSGQMSTFLSVIEEMERVSLDRGVRGRVLGLKEYLVSPSILSCPDPREDLYMYLNISEHAVSAVMLKNQKGVQRPIYYINKTLVNVETLYLLFEKLALALVHATRKLPHYFQEHTVYVLTEYPLQSLLRRSDFIGRIAK